MTEPRMRMRQKGQQFPSDDLEAYLIAFGDDRDPLPETVKVLDEIITDFIIEACHEAAAAASHSRRAKIKVDDFKFMLRRDAAKLGRISELIAKDKEMKAQRKAFNTDEGAVVKGGPKEDGEAKGRGKKRERGDEDDEGSLISGVGADGGKGLKKKKRKKKADGDAEGSVAGSARGR